MSWIDDLQDASFRGIAFQVEKPSTKGGRRNAKHEYPMRETPNVEDMGAKIAQFTLTAFIIGTSGVLDACADFRAALRKGGSGLLIHPFYGQMQVNVEDWTETADLIKEQNIVRYSLTFVESGDKVVTTPSADTAQGSATAANNATTANSTSFADSFAGNLA